MEVTFEAQSLLSPLQIAEEEEVEVVVVWPERGTKETKKTEVAIGLALPSNYEEGTPEEGTKEPDDSY